MGRVRAMEARVVFLPESQQEMVRSWLRTATEAENHVVARRAMQCAVLVFRRNGL
jgi:hypothetical protein